MFNLPIFHYQFALYGIYSLLLEHARTERGRIRAVSGLGKTENLRATPALLAALDDASPEVRREAALALGRIHAGDAVPRLIRELEDNESDIRCEAAEALGKIRDKAALVPLLRALSDRDIRLRNTAVSALATLGGEEVREKLVELFVVSYDTDMFPSLADSLSYLGEQAIVEPVMRCLGEYKSMVLRLQLLNAVCRALGAGNEFYRILSKHEYARVNEVNRLIRQARRIVQRSPLFRKETVAGVSRILRVIAESYRTEDHRAFLRSVWEFMAYIQLVLPEFVSSESAVSHADSGHDHHRPYIEAVNRFLALKEIENIRDEGMVFLVVCISCLLKYNS